LAAVPRPDPAAPRAAALVSGDPPSPRNPPPGCRFHTRCAFADDRCRTEDPALADPGDGHAVACHHWQKLPMDAPVAASDMAGRARLARLASYFTGGNRPATTLETTGGPR
ncbi:oligopeptide/dipeptide ABC transporter ATP-binding protein, partial [Elioraea rosea]|uniref:oligopeptide/dipeptide ABC transporter ATP-binding protein n=1 Tax=Elioraea rosea TaxID=2492390 RepID=UPI003084541A